MTTGPAHPPTSDSRPNGKVANCLCLLQTLRLRDRHNRQSNRTRNDTTEGLGNVNTRRPSMHLDLDSADLGTRSTLQPAATEGNQRGPTNMYLGSQELDNHFRTVDRAKASSGLQRMILLSQKAVIILARRIDFRFRAMLGNYDASAGLD